MHTKIIQLNPPKILEIQEFSDPSIFLPQWRTYQQGIDQPFHVRDINGVLLCEEKEPLWGHICKDLRAVKAVLAQDLEAFKYRDDLEKDNILADGSLSTEKLKEAIQEYHDWMNASTLSEKLLRCYYIFIYYHDIGKANGDRADHENKGLQKFLALGLQLDEKLYGSKAIEKISWLIKYHGEYREIDKARRASGKPNDYSDNLNALFLDLNTIEITSSEKITLLRLMGLFNFVEGIQSDQFGWTMCRKDTLYNNEYKYLDIKFHYDQLIKRF